MQIYASDIQTWLGNKFFDRGSMPGFLRAGLPSVRTSQKHDTGLSRYFITTQSYIALQSLRKHVVIGPKGSGKSAMLKGLANDSTESLVITPEHYATEVLDALAKSPNTTESAG